MKPEWIAALLLLLMLTFSIGNLLLLKKSVEALTDLTESIRENALQEDWASARKNADAASGLWKKRLNIFQLTLRHAETAQVTQLFSDLFAALEGEDGDGAAQSAAEIGGILAELLRLEEPRMSTIF